MNIYQPLVYSFPGLTFACVSRDTVWVFVAGSTDPMSFEVRLDGGARPGMGVFVRLRVDTP